MQLYKRLLSLVVFGTLVLTLSGCTKANQPEDKLPPVTTKKEGSIYLYGEMHAVKAILDKEVQLWKAHYDSGMRHLFVELSYFTGEFLNQWMQAEEDTHLTMLFDEWEGTAAHNPYIQDFYKAIKTQCPETVFHGTDVGHQYWSTGKRYLTYLEQNKLQDTEQYRLAQEAIAQGEQYYNNNDDAVYRENTMVENFMREYDLLKGEGIMGIYGTAHTGLEALDYTGQVPSMANQLQKHYGDIIQAQSLEEYARNNVPEKTETMEIGGKTYTASYFGEQDLSSLIQGYESREFWRLEDAYADFQNAPKTGDKLPYDNYLMAVETGQVFVIDYVKTDGTQFRKYYRSDGKFMDGERATEEFTIQ